MNDEPDESVWYEAWFPIGLCVIGAIGYFASLAGKVFAAIEAALD